MHRLGLALDELHRLMKSDVDARANVPAIVTWIDQLACPAVRDAIHDPRFQQIARWPLDNLVPGATTPIRQLVERVDGALIDHALQLRAFAQSKQIWERLLSLDRAGIELSLATERPTGFDNVDFISRRPWRDLASPLDYFGAFMGCNLIIPDEVPFALFLPYANPALRSLGDFISRMLIQRLAHWQHELHVFYVKCFTARREITGKVPRNWGKVAASAATLSETSMSLMSHLKSDDSDLRNSCIAIVQTYAAFRPAAALSWLKLDCNVVRHGGAYWSALIERRLDLTVVKRIGVALEDVQELCETHASLDDMVRQFVESKQLVLVERPPRVYWQGKLLQADWDDKRAIFDFLWELASRTQHKSELDPDGMGSLTKSTLVNRCSRLKTYLAPELRNAIKPNGRGGYRLDIAPDAIETVRVDLIEKAAEID
jgi:hypothetical protein